METNVDPIMKFAKDPVCGMEVDPEKSWCI